MCNIYYLQGHFLEAEFPLLAVSISPNCCRADWALHQHQQGALGSCWHAQVKLQCSACMCQGHCRLLWLRCRSRELRSSGASGNRRAVPQSPQCIPVRAGLCWDWGTHSKSQLCKSQLSLLLWDRGCSAQPAALHRGYSCPLHLQARDQRRALSAGAVLCVPSTICLQSNDVTRCLG